MWYVTATDKFMSGWGGAEGRTSKVVFECDGCADAEIVAENARLRGDFTYINITTTKPYYSPKRYHTSVYAYDESKPMHVYRSFAKGNK